MFVEHNRRMNKTAGVLVALAMLFMVSCFSASIDDVCIALKAVSLPPTSQQHILVPDAVTGIDISSALDLAWVSPKDCKAGSKSHKSTSDWANVPELCLTIVGDEHPQCTEGKTRSVIDASLDGDNYLTVSARLEFSFKLTISSGTIPITGEIGFDLKNIPSALLGRAVPVWTGSLYGSANGVTIADSDLFDGVFARVYNATEGGQATEETAATIQRIAQLSTDVAARVKFFEMVPSALAGDLTARMAFPDPLSLMKVEAKDVKMLGTDIAYATAVATCQDDTCGQAMNRVMKNFAESEDKCGNATLSHIFGSISAIVTVNLATGMHSVVSSHAWVQGALDCSTTGDVLLTFEALSDADTADNEYDTQMFVEDNHAAVSMSKSVGMTLSGSRVAAVGLNGGNVATTMEGDLFGNGRGGVFVEDVVISTSTKDQFVSAVQNFISELKTGRTGLDTAVYNSIMRNTPETVFDNYFARTATPTGHGLWQYWAHQVNGIEIMVDESSSRSGLVANVDMTLRSAPLKFDLQDPAFTSMNSVLAAVHRDLKGGDKNLTAPVLTASTSYTISKLDGAVSARIAIPKLTAGFRLRANTDVDSWALATVGAKFGDDCTLASARLTLMLGKDISEDTPVVEYATKNSALGGDVIARTSSGTIINDEEWDVDTVHAIGNSLTTVLNNINKTLTTSVEQLRLVSEGASATYADVVAELQKTLASTSQKTKSVSGLMKDIQTALSILVDKVNSNPLIIHFGIVPDHKAGSIDFAFDAFAIRHFTSDTDSSEWKRTIPLPRLAVQTPTTTKLYFKGVSKGDGVLSTFTTIGESSVAGWSLPVRSGMRHGLVSGTASLSINFPDSALLIIDLTGKMVRGDEIKAHFEGNMTVHMDESSTVIPSDFFTWTFSESNRGDYSQAVQPEDVVHGFFDNGIVMSSVPKYRLASPVPPFASALSEFFDISDMWDTEHAYFYTDDANPVLAAATLQFPVDAFDEDYNFTINNVITKWCEMRIPALTSQNAEQEFSDAIKKCDMSRYVRVSYIPNTENTEFDDEDDAGRIVFYPATPGMVYAFSVSTDSNTTAPLKTQSWKAGQTMPDALSWNDFYDSVYATFFRNTGVEYNLPELQTISLDDLALVDASRAEYYPKEIPAMLFPISFQLSSSANAVPVKSSLESSNLNTHFDISENFTMPAAVTGEVSTSYGYAFWCSLGDGSLNMSTSFSEVNETFENVVVPDAPNNTFSITFQYETRNKADVNAIPPVTNFQQVVSLTPGVLAGEQLLKLGDIITDEKIKKMIVVDTVVDPLREPVLTQVSLMFMPFVDETAGTIDVPLSVTIDNSGIPYWGNGENPVISNTLTTCAINKDFTTRFTVHSSPATNDDAKADCNGITGVVSANATATLTTEQVFVASSLKKYEFQAHLISSVVDDNLFGRFFDSAADIQTTFDLSDFKFGVNRVEPGDLASQVLRFFRNATHLPFGNLSQLVNSKFVTDVISNGASALLLKTLSSSDRSHLCTALKLANTASESFATDSANQESLPMVESSVGPLFEQRLGSILSSISESVCSDSGELTVDPLCLTLSKGWGVQACADIAIEDRALSLYVKAEPPPFKVDTGFKFDVNKLIPFAKKNYSAGIGGDGDFVLLANTSAAFGIRLEFVNSNKTAEENALVDKWSIKVSLDPAHTKFNAAAGLDANSQVKASFGSIVLNFASASVHLDAHVDASWSEANKIDVNIDGSASLKAGVSLEPIFSCNIEASVPSLAAFIYGRNNSAVWKESCGSGTSFLDALEALIDDMNFAKFFEQDPSLFWKQFSKNLDKIFDELITKLLDRAVAFIGKQLQGLVHKALDQITGPEVAEAVGKDIAEMVAHIILNHTAPTGEELERIVLTVFTGIMNKQFAPLLKEPIPTPEPNPKDGRYVWAMRFGKVTTKPLTNIDFHLGGHGLAQFGVQCQPELQLDWSVSFDLVWTKGSGITVEWPVTPAFGGKVTISSNNQCTMEGRLLFLGAVLTATLKCDVALQVVPNEQKKLQALEFYADASIQGEAQIGLVGILGAKIEDNIKNSLPALPHVKAGILMTWGVDLRTDHKGQDTPNKFEFQDPKLCLGTMLTKFLKRITDQIYKVVRPLLPIFGKDGILLKKISVLKPFLNDHNDLLGIIELMCHFFSDSCNVASVRQLCEVIRQVSDVLDMLEKFDQWLSGDPEGCTSFSMIYKTFHVNWTRSDPQPEAPVSANGMLRDYDDEGHFDFGDELDEKQKAELSTQTTGWQTGGQFKFTLDILQNFPSKLIQILLGGNVPLFSFSFPYASFGFSTSWSIPVWAFPYVEIVVEAHASIEFHPPPIALMSNAVVDTIRTHNPSHIFRNFALRALEDGKPFFFIKGSVEFGGGAGVGLSIFLVSVTGEATIFVKFEAGIAVASINNEEWTTFDTVAMQLRTQGLQGTVDIELQFTGGFRIALKGCVHLIFTKKCWTIASKSWSYTFGSWSIKPKTLPSVADTDGTINGDAANDNIPSDDPTSMFLPGGIYARSDEYARFTITPTDVMLLARTQSDADAPRQRQLSSNPSIRFNGDVCKGKISVSVVGDVNFPIQLPGCGDALLNVSQSNYESSGSSFSITRNTVRAGDRPAMTFGEKWGSVVLSEAAFGTSYDISGIPACPVKIETGELSTLSIHGKPSDYDSTIEMTGSLQDTTATVLCSDFNINLDHFNCTAKSTNGMVDLITPSVMRSFTAVASVAEESVFHIHATPKGRTVSLTSATSYTNFSVPDFANIKGYTECIGNSAGQMYLLSTMRTRQESPATVRLSLSSAELDNGDGFSHVVRHTNVPYREFDIHGAESQYTETVLMPPTEFDVVTLRMHSKANSNMTHYVTGCHVRSGVQISLDATGDSYQTVVFGDKQGLKSSACSPSVVSLSDKVKSHIIVNAGQDDRQLRWEFRPGKFSVSSLDAHSDTFQVLYNNINRITVNFAAQSSDVLINTQLGSTDLVLNFPETDGAANNKLTITGSPASVLVNGPVDVIKIGSQDDYNYKTPFSSIGGMVAVSHDTIISLDSSKSANVVDHAFRMNSLCLVDAVGQNSSNWKSISPWIREQAQAYGMQVPEDGAECSLLYNSNAKQSLQISTGNGIDSFYANGASIPVSLNLGGNSDNVTLRNTNGVKFAVDLGQGADYLDIASTGDVDADLGDDQNTDIVNVHYKGSSPSIDGTSIHPVGENNAKLSLTNWLQQDLISVLRDSDKRSLNNRFRAGEIVLINTTVKGVPLRYEQDSDTTYLIVGCASMDTLSFDVYSSSSSTLAYNANVYVNVNDVSSRCTVNVNSEIAANGTAGVLIPADMKDPPTSMRMEKSNDPVGTGLFTYGSLQIHPTNISHFEVSIPFMSTLKTEGTIDIRDVPSNADLILSSPGVEWNVNIISLHSTAVILDAEVNVYSGVLQSKIPLICAGNSKTSVVHVNADQAKEINFVSGCMLTEDGQRGYSISDWIMWHTFVNYSVWIGETHICNIETMNVSSVTIGNCSNLGVGGLSPVSTNEVFVTDVKNLNLTVDPDIHSAILQKDYGKWAQVKFKSAPNKSSCFTARRTNGETFTINVVGADNVSVNRGITKFDVGSLLMIDCADTESETAIDMHMPYSTEVQMRASMNVTSPKCKALINNMISTNTSVAPSVLLGHGLKLDLSMTILPPYVPDSLQNTSDASVRSLKILANSTTNRTNYLLTERSVDNKTVALVDIEWDSVLTEDIQHDLRDSARYVLDFDAGVIESNFVHMNVSSGALLSFGDLHDSTVLFVSAKTSDFTPEKRRFSLTPSNKSGDYCFDPCQDCTEGAWGRVVISGKICQPRSAQDSCKQRAKVVVNITDILEGVSCGAAPFDDERNNTCSFAMNINGHDNGVLTIPDAVMTGTTIIIALSILLTIVGASSLIARLVFACKGYPNINVWWTNNSFRDLLTDQFSWAAIVITACFPEVVDVDYAQWGGWVVAIMMRAKMFVLNWFVTCSDDGEPVWVTPATIVFWIVTVITVALRIFEIVRRKRSASNGLDLNPHLTNAFFAIQSVLTVTGFLLMPLVGYSLAFLNATSYAGFVSVVCFVLLFCSQPIGNPESVSGACISGSIGSVLNILIPVAMCIYVGIGAEFVPLVVIALCCAVILPIIDVVLLWLSFFRRARFHPASWKNSVGWTISLRIVSALCGVAFLILLFFDLSETVSKIAAGLWFGWVCIPFLCVIPLTAGVPSILKESKTVSSFSSSGYDKEENHSLLRGNFADPDGDEETL